MQIPHSSRDGVTLLFMIGQMFHHFLQMIGNTVIRDRLQTNESKAFMYLEKMRHSTAFEDQAFCRNLVKSTCHDNFWEYAVKQYQLDDGIKYRNHNLPTLNLP